MPVLWREVEREGQVFPQNEKQEMSKIRYELTVDSPEWLYVLKELCKESITFPNASITYTLNHQNRKRPIDAVVEFDIEEHGKIYEILASMVRKKK